MHATTTVPDRVLKDCPRCGGWARKLEEASARLTCRGCRWSGFAA